MRVRVGRSETESWSSGRSVFVVTVRRTSLSLSLQYYDIKLLINNLINKPQPRHFCISTFVFISICRMDRLYPPIYWYFVYNIYIYIYTYKSNFCLRCRYNGARNPVYRSGGGGMDGMVGISNPIERSDVITAGNWTNGKCILLL